MNAAVGLAWSPKLAVGVYMIDAQHQKLIELTEALFSAHALGAGPESFRAAVDGLVAYAGEHFTEEEELLKAGKSTRFEAHREEHLALTNEVLALRKLAEIDLPGAIRGSALWLAERLIPHITGPDREAFAACQRPLGPDTHIARTSINGESIMHVVVDDKTA